MWFSEVNGAWPTHPTPSPPMWLISEVRRSGIQIAMPWQPMPAIARLPSGTRVEVLCGQPEQKNGVRATLPAGAFSSFSLASRRAMRCRSSGESPVCFISRLAITMATPVGAHEGAHRRRLRPVQALLGLERRIGSADAEPARRQLEVGRHHDLQALGIDPHRGARFDGLGDRLEADPAARVARQGETQDAE